MTTNISEITINAPVEKVWLAIIDKEQAQKWMNHVELHTNWGTGESIEVVCYDEQHQILKVSDDKEMRWMGTIVVFAPNEELDCVFPHNEFGLAKENYKFERLTDLTTKVTITQDCDSAEEGWKTGAEETLASLKKFVEEN